MLLKILVTYRHSRPLTDVPTGTRIEPIWSSLSQVFAVERGAPHELPIRTIVYSGDEVIRKLHCTPEGGVVIWECEVPVVAGESGRISRVADAILYVDDDQMVCLDLVDGRPRWSRPCAATDRPADRIIRADDAIVYNTKTTLVCVNLVDGGLRWSRPCRAVNLVVRAGIITAADQHHRQTSYSTTDGTPRDATPTIMVDAALLDGVCFEITGSMLEVEGRWEHDFGALWDAMSLEVVGSRVAIALGCDSTDPNTARLALASLDRVTASIELGSCDNAHYLDVRGVDEAAIVRGSTTWIVDVVAERVVAVIAPGEPAVQLVGSLAAWQHAL